MHQRPDDFDALTLTYRQLPDLASWIERKAINIGHFLKTRGHVLERFLAVETQRHVFGDGEIVEQREMLEHHADAERAGIARRGDVHELAANANFAVIGGVVAVEDFCERALPGAILAEERHHLAGPHVEMSDVVDEQAAEPLDDPVSLDERRPVSHADTQKTFCLSDIFGMYFA